MKKTLLAAILATAGTCSVFAQGAVHLDNYNSAAQPLITYGSGVVGQTAGTAVSGYTMGFYYVVGSTAAAVNSSFDANENTVNWTSQNGLALATGAAGSCALSAGQGNTPGDFLVPGTSASVGQAVTLVVVAYNGASYATSTVRGHSAAFAMNTQVSPFQGSLTGDFMNAFSVTTVVPEPSTFALAGLGLASLLIFRRRK